MMAIISSHVSEARHGAPAGAIGEVGEDESSHPLKPTEGLNGAPGGRLEAFGTRSAFVRTDRFDGFNTDGLRAFL
jgi:hypothetical protein